MRAGLILAAVAVVASSGGAEAATPLQVLRRAAAPLTTDYEAVQVITAAGPAGPETVRALVWHRRPHTYRTEFLSPARLAGRVVVDDGVQSWTYDPSLHLLIQGPSLATSDSVDVTEVAHGYTVRLLGTDLVAEREAYLVTLLPKSGGSTRRLWVDRATGLVLKREASDPERGVYLTSVFTRVSFRPLPPELFRVPRPRGARLLKLTGGGSRLATFSEVSRLAGFPVAAPQDLPAGYRFRAGRVARMGSVTAAVLEFTDGVSTASVIVIPAARMGVPPGGEVVRRGDIRARLHAVGLFQVLVWERGGMRMSVVADAPVAVLAQLASSLDPDPTVEARRVSETARMLGVPAHEVAALRDLGLTFTQIHEAVGTRFRPTAYTPLSSRQALVAELERFQQALRSGLGSAAGP